MDEQQKQILNIMDKIMDTIKLLSTPRIVVSANKSDELALSIDEVDFPELE